MERKDVHFLWIGIQKNSVEHQNILYDLDKMGIPEHVHVIAPTMDNMDYMACFDTSEQKQKMKTFLEK